MGGVKVKLKSALKKKKKYVQVGGNKFPSARLWKRESKMCLSKYIIEGSNLL